VAKFDTEKPDSISGELGQGGSANEALFFGKGCQRDEEHPKPNAKPQNADNQQRPEKQQQPDNQQPPTKDTAPTR
jgi:hypothetical protein